MIKTLKNLFKQDKERFLIPNGVQDVIPIRKIYDDGVFQVGDDKFSKTYKFTDINYAVASREDKETMFLEYSELLNSFDSGATTKITINNRRLNRVDFEKNILIPLTGDALDEYRKEYNSMLLEKAIDANAITQEKYITISVNKKSVEEARNYFARVGAELITHFDRLGSKCITVSHKTAYDMASKYGFNQEQREYLDELLSDENNSLWSSVLYGTSGEDNQIVAVALSQAGNVGGRPYWSWYGFNSRVEWCACFVSWCANECGYIETGIIPKYASCVNGVQWFKDRGQWLDGSAEPLPGMIIFYDWDKQGQSGQQDGRADHTGIVWKVENGYVYTIEGNLSDKCMTSRRPIGEYQILGYGVPQY